MSTDKRQFTMRMQNDTFEKIRYVAFMERRSIAAEIEHLILEYIEKYEAANGVIQIPVSE